MAEHESIATAAGQPRLVVIAGPTAVGKTGLGVALGQRFDGEVISADSRYLYRGFDIGVAKPDIVERGGVHHHLIDAVPPDGEMSLATYQELAYGAIEQTVARGHQPLLVGGTPLYVNAVIEGWRIPRVPPNPALRAALATEADTIGVPALAERLRAVDPVAAARAGANLRRVIRALEVYEATGVPMSAQEGKGPRPFATLELGLTMPRDRLYQAIDARVDNLIERGLVAEVRSLLEGGVAPDAPAHVKHRLSPASAVPPGRDQPRCGSRPDQDRHPPLRAPSGNMAPSQPTPDPTRRHRGRLGRGSGRAGRPLSGNARD